MASVTRSTRRATNTEGLVQQQLHPVPIPRPHPHPLHHPVQAFAAANTNTVTRAASTPQNINTYHHSIPGRTKRQIDAADNVVDFDHQKPKRPRTSIEILIRPAPSPARPAVANANATTTTPNVTSTPQPTTTTTPRPPAPLPKPTPRSAPQHVATVHPPNPTPAPANGNAAQLTKHQEKVINGIKHELDRLQPRDVDTHTKEGGRKLRSQEATRFKSELSAYFPEYDEVIGNEPKEQQLFSIDTPIVVFDSNPTRHQPVSWQRYLGTTAEFRAIRDASASLPDAHRVPVRGYGDALFDELVDAQRIDFDFLGISHKREPVEDPLPDATFVSAHKRAERLEKSIRNTEKGRAQHEKDQIARLLDGLQGHDWLRVMGVSGVTETRKKQFEPARQHFIKGCQAILDKFRQWSLEEKRRKAEKDRALAEKAEAEDTSEAQRAGRKVVAWGHPVPEIPEEDFDLPEEFRDEETLRVHARKKRRDRRGRH
ncbi:uncharacterized protein ColSpa_01976 [Colletotrichum spaethianum]|uniref:Something about silencing protein 4 domain-containing protein n=1 Tax=Colletotrichum spaethianum TaxID=700344 RepID=A0AA37NWZ2_9PEZI|nr:uncharacterized protein ColSpa_01976 [Colletotrichum spaethianum]GKT41795.1 hypothetical protein ColSpa_01976 [Colletotrichum spaethianum]